MAHTCVVLLARIEFPLPQPQCLPSLITIQTSDIISNLNYDIQYERYWCCVLKCVLRPLILALARLVQFHRKSETSVLINHYIRSTLFTRTVLIFITISSYSVRVIERNIGKTRRANLSENRNKYRVFVPLQTCVGGQRADC